MHSNGILNDILGGGTAEKLLKSRTLNGAFYATRNDVLEVGTAEKRLKIRTLNGAF